MQIYLTLTRGVRACPRRLPPPLPPSSVVVQLKSRVSKLLKVKVPSSAFLRFLRAREFNVELVTVTSPFP